MHTKIFLVAFMDNAQMLLNLPVHNCVKNSAHFLNHQITWDTIALGNSSSLQLSRNQATNPQYTILKMMKACSVENICPLSCANQSL